MLLACVLGITRSEPTNICRFSRLIFPPFQDTLVTVNWRTKTVSEMTLDGRHLASFSHKVLQEPIAVAVTHRGEFVVVDSVSGVIIFDQCGKLIRNLPQKYF